MIPLGGLRIFIATTTHYCDEFKQGLDITHTHKSTMVDISSLNKIKKKIITVWFDLFFSVKQPHIYTHAHRPNKSIAKTLDQSNQPTTTTKKHR